MQAQCPGTKKTTSYFFFFNFGDLRHTPGTTRCSWTQSGREAENIIRGRSTDSAGGVWVSSSNNQSHELLSSSLKAATHTHTEGLRSLRDKKKKKLILMSDLFQNKQTNKNTAPQIIHMKQNLLSVVK